MAKNTVTVLNAYGEPSEVTYSGPTRVVKHLIFPYFYEGESPMQPGMNVFFEKMLKRGEILNIEESGIRPADLAKGESLGSFFNDEELAAMENAGQAPENPDANPSFNASEAGEHELAEHITEQRLNIDETVALSGGDPVVAQRILEAESIASGGDSRKGVVAGLTAVIEAGNQ